MTHISNIKLRQQNKELLSNYRKSVSKALSTIEKAQEKIKQFKDKYHGK